MDLLEEMYPKIDDWFKVYEKKLLGGSIPCTFSYRERTSTLTEQSNMDDYPRGTEVHDRAEIHLDLQTQMIDFALTMRQYANHIYGHESVSAEFYGN